MVAAVTVEAGVFSTPITFTTAEDGMYSVPISVTECLEYWQTIHQNGNTMQRVAR